MALQGLCAWAVLLVSAVAIFVIAIGVCVGTL